MSAELMRSYLDLLNEQNQLDEDWQHKMLAMSMAGMVDMLNENNQLDEDWKKKLAAAGMAGVMGLSALGGASAADMPGKDPGADRPVAAQSEYGSMIEIEGKVKDLAKVDAKAALLLAWRWSFSRSVRLPLLSSSSPSLLLSAT